MPERLFLFIQMEFPWELGPPDGRYVLRAQAGADPERVVVLGTLAADRAASRRAGPGRLRRSLGADAGPQATPEPAPVRTSRATIVDPVSLSAERQAQAWLSQLDSERESQAAISVLNRILHAHRIASADPHIHEVSAAQALVIRAGWGDGEQVAYGRWLHALELPRASRRVRRVAALRPQERLAELLGARGEALLCEELLLRARLDLDHGRLIHGAVELNAAYAAALPELRAEDRQDLAIRIAELDQLRAGVVAQALAAMPAAGDSTDATASTGPLGEEKLDEEVLRHALQRLEAALRARTATGFARD
ncbi:MAG TPA: hypothetical protein VGG98_08265 [Solirubrobacteraceae bacterium]|jgi:hypothetical protein